MYDSRTFTKCLLHFRNAFGSKHWKGDQSSTLIFWWKSFRLQAICWWKMPPVLEKTALFTLTLFRRGKKNRWIRCPRNKTRSLLCKSTLASKSARSHHLWYGASTVPQGPMASTHGRFTRFSNVGDVSSWDPCVRRGLTLNYSLDFDSQITVSTNYGTWDQNFPMTVTNDQIAK